MDRKIKLFFEQRQTFSLFSSASTYCAVHSNCHLIHTEYIYLNKHYLPRNFKLLKSFTYRSNYIALDIMFKILVNLLILRNGIFKLYVYDRVL